MLIQFLGDEQCTLKRVNVQFVGMSTLKRIAQLPAEQLGIASSEYDSDYDEIDGDGMDRDEAVGVVARAVAESRMMAAFASKHRLVAAKCIDLQIITEYALTIDFELFAHLQVLDVRCKRRLEFLNTEHHLLKSFSLSESRDELATIIVSLARMSLMPSISICWHRLRSRLCRCSGAASRQRWILNNVLNLIRSRWTDQSACTLRRRDHCTSQSLFARTSCEDQSRMEMSSCAAQ